jgi:hypothetical protein
MIDISLYHLHSRINPRNIPQLRMIRYDGMGPNQTGGSIGWLKKIMIGDISADLPRTTGTYSRMMEWGSEEKNNQVW